MCHGLQRRMCTKSQAAMLLSYIRVGGARPGAALQEQQDGQVEESHSAQPDIQGAQERDQEAQEAQILVEERGASTVDIDDQTDLHCCRSLSVSHGWSSKGWCNTADTNPVVLQLSERHMIMVHCALTDSK